MQCKEQTMHLLNFKILILSKCSFHNVMHEFLVQIQMEVVRLVG